MPYTYPRQLKGIGMSRMASNQEIENSYFLDTNRQGVDQLLATNNDWLRTRFVARISTSVPPVPLASVGLIVVRWTYTLVRQVFPGTPIAYADPIVDPDGLQVTAYNLYEWYNATGIFGDGTNIGNIPANTYLVPVTGLVFVTAYRMQRTLANTDIVYLFERNNGYECPDGLTGGGGEGGGGEE